MRIVHNIIKDKEISLKLQVFSLEKTGKILDHYDRKKLYEKGCVGTRVKLHIFAFIASINISGIWNVDVYVLQ